MNWLKHRKGFVAVLILFLLLLVFLIFRVVYAVNVSQKSIEIFLNSAESENKIPHFPEGEARDLAEEIFGLEQKLELAKLDSISLIIDLSDSLVQIHLKGMDLFHSKILKQYPDNFLYSVNPETYTQMAKVSEIKSEASDFPKKPIKKVKAPKNGTPPSETKKDTIPIPELNWQFTTENNISVVITGVKMEPDSTFHIHSLKDLLKYRSKTFLSEIIPSHFSPTLYLWLNDAEAKSIYRAVPENGKVLFRF